MGTGVQLWWVGGWELGTLQPWPGLAGSVRNRSCCLSPGLGLGDTLSFHFAPQIEPPSHHLSPEEVRIGILGRQAGAGNTVLGHWPQQGRGALLGRNPPPPAHRGCLVSVPAVQCWGQGGWGGLTLQWADGGPEVALLCLSGPCSMRKLSTPSCTAWVSLSPTMCARPLSCCGTCRR